MSLSNSIFENSQLNGSMQEQHNREEAVFGPDRDLCISCNGRPTQQRRTLYFHPVVSSFFLSIYIQSATAEIRRGKKDKR